MQGDLRKYAELAVKVGVNVQPGQPFFIGYGQRQVLPEHVEFVRLLTEVAYDAGASFVHVEYGDEAWMRETVKRGQLDILEAKYRWQLTWVEELAKQNAAYLAIPASDPKLYEGIDPERVQRANRIAQEVFRDFTNRRTNSTYSWSLSSVPTQAWANQVHPELPESARVKALWEDILFCVRVTGHDDAVADWKSHIANLQRRSKWLNDMKVKSFHYKAPGTDLTVDMPDGYYFKSALDNTPGGVPFVANMPTEEVYGAPHRRGVNGTISSTMPLNHGGSLIKGIKLRFEEGRIVEYSADEGRDALTSIIETDEGSHYLGEIALVPVDSPISRRGTLFYNTLFDENASCHFAIGRAYPLIEGGRDLPHAEWDARGLNDSLVHVDFMVGSPEMSIDAVLHNQSTVPIFRQGKWASEA